MQITHSNKLHINVAVLSNTATISLAGHFSFDAHREFKSAYTDQLDSSSVGVIVINFASVEYLDSSALGMLLLLRDRAQASNKSLVLSRPSSITQRTFDIAGFYNMFNIC